MSISFISPPSAEVLRGFPAPFLSRAAREGIIPPCPPAGGDVLRRRASGRMEPPMSANLLTLPEAARLIGEGQMICLGGNSLTRLPSAFARELARQGKRGLRLVKTAGAY